MSWLRFAKTAVFLIALCVAQGAAGQVLENEELGSGTTAAPKDTLPKAKRSDPAWQYAGELQLGKDSFNKWDSSFLMVHGYNPVIRRALPFVDLGTTASPHRFLTVDPAARPGFYTGLNPYPLLDKVPDSLRFYRAKVPLSRFYYTQGGRGVFMLHAQHTQNFSPNWNISADFSSIQNGDVYINSSQAHLHRATMLGNNFKTKNGVYENMLIVNWNRARRVENRGLEHDSLFFIPSDSGRLRIVGNYVPASTSAKSFYANHHHLMEQKLYVDAQKNYYVFHRFDWLKEKYEYNEPNANKTPNDSQFYGNAPVFVDSLFHDSTVWIQWNNSFGIGHKAANAGNGLYWRAWYSADRIAYNSLYKTTENIYFNQALHGIVSGEQNALNWRLNAHYYFSGYNAGDYLVDGTIRYNMPKNISLFVLAKSQQFQAPFISEKFAGNYILYNAKRTPTTANSLTVGGQWHSSHIGFQGKLQTGNANHLVYTDVNSVFQQTGSISFVNFEGLLRLRLGKFHFDNKFTLQKNSQKELLPYPVFTDLSTLYFEGQVFKKAMLARIGVDMWYMSEYTGYRYQPMNGTFYPGNIKAGNYPWFDLYFSGEVKTMMLFLKVEHLNNYLTNYGFNTQYVSALSYPTEPLRVRFGFIWRFYN